MKRERAPARVAREREKTRTRRSREHAGARTRRIRFALASSSRIGVGMSSPEYLTCRQRREAAYKTRTKCIVTSERWSETEEPSERGAKRRSRRRRKTGGAPSDASREDQVKLASFASGVEVALVVSASIDWGKRCPHFLAREGVRPREGARKKQRERLLFARVAESPDETNAAAAASPPSSPLESAVSGRAYLARGRAAVRRGPRALRILRGRGRERPRRRRASARGILVAIPFRVSLAEGGGRSSGVVSERREKKRRIDRPVARGSSASRSRSAFASRRDRAARSGRGRAGSSGVRSEGCEKERVLFNDRGLEASWVNSGSFLIADVRRRGARWGGGGPGARARAEGSGCRRRRARSERVEHELRTNRQSAGKGAWSDWGGV